MKPSKPSTYFSKELLLNQHLLVISNISTSWASFWFTALHVASWTIQPGRYSKAPTLNHSGTWMQRWHGNLENRNSTWMQRWHGRFMSKLKSGIHIIHELWHDKYLFLIPMGFHLHVKYPTPVFSFESSDRLNFQINSIHHSYHLPSRDVRLLLRKSFRFSLITRASSWEFQMSMLYM